MNEKIENSPKLQRYPEFLALGVLFLLPFYFLRIKAGWVSTNPPEILIAVFFIVWLLYRSRQQKLTSAVFQNIILKSRGYFAAIFLIIIGVTLSIFAGGKYHTGFGILKGWFLLPIIFAFVSSDLLKDEENLIKRYFQTIFYSGAFVSFFGLIYWFRGILAYDGRLRLFYDSPNQLAMTLAPAFLVGIFLLREYSIADSQKGKFWLINALFLGLVGINIFLTKSVGAWATLILTLLVVCLRTGWNKKAKTRLVILLISFFALLSLVFFQSADLKIKIIGERSSLASRVMIWKSAVLIIKDNPLTGIGPGNFQEKYLEYQKYFPPYLEWAVPEPHNVFLSFWLGTGILGFIGFLLLLIKFFGDNIKKAAYHNREAALICFSIILYFLLHGLVDTTYWKNDSAIVFWIVISINVFLVQKKDSI